MKFILAQPAIKRFKWELDVCLTNLRSLGVKDIVLLFSKFDASIPNYFKRKYGVQCFVYPDLRKDKTYIPSIKPYLWWQFLKENPEMEKETFFYMDADVIFKELPDFTKINYSKDLWVGSNADEYLCPNYIDSKGKDLLSRMANIIQVDEQKVRNLQNRSAGAQWIITQPGTQYWFKVYCDSVKLYKFLNNVELAYVTKYRKIDIKYTPIQKWTAEMWAQLWNLIYFNIDVAISSELDFCWATDDIKRWDAVKIYHNAGVTMDMQDLFFKGLWVNKSPFNANLDYVNKNKCSWKYVQAIKAAR